MNGSEPKVTSPKESVIDEETMESAPFFLKAIVVGLGIAIIAMLALILYKIVTGPEAEEEAPEPVVETVLPPSRIEAKDFDVAVPQGAALVSMVPAGTEVFLHVRLSDGTDQVIILNRVTGDVSRLSIKPSGE
ncbi:MAG: hypothetical protein JJ850_08110 [Kordiimonadaceae bacterium]|nr:hypothetical protein [Kordiimonadaceae bacterium]MBO6569091.1 hypothetical protein [Kordiimonadaceae bacterium]MBO6964566.1 hypothetical protein [Kordiimonadaceae bacterium]